MVAATLGDVAGFSPAGQKTQPDSSNFYKYILLVLAVCVCLPARLAADSPSATFSIAPVSPAFVAWQAKAGPVFAESRDEQGHALGFIPSPLDRSHLISQASVLATQLVGTPSSYDLRTLGYVTPVRDQGNCGSCWAFGSYGPPESWLLKNVAETWDFSENHLKNYHGFDPAPCSGGNADMSTAYLTRWSGPVSEADDPYHDYDDRPSPGGPCRKYVQNVLWFFTASDIKSALMTYGGMYVSMYMSSAYYNPSEYTYYYSGSTSTNHAVTLIGWDDSKVVTGAPDIGAWLIKNSWGTGWGDSGYFWISYYDTVAVQYAVAFCDAVPTSSYVTNYQYDPLGWTQSLGYSSSTAWAANIFTATANEQLTAVGLYAVDDAVSYTIYVYDNFNGSTFSGLLGSVSGTLSNSGYHTIPLTSPINLTTSNDFSIVVKFTTTGYGYPIPVEMDFAGYSSGATASPGQSYISSTGTTFYDITTYSGFENTNVCIRGLTIANTQASAPSPANGATNISLTPTLSWTAGAGATSHDVYFGTASPGTFQGNQTGTTFAPGTLLPNTTYYWRIDEKNAGGTTTGLVWSFTTAPLPGQASSPSPANGASGVSESAVLSWTAGSNTTSHDVYFGTTSPGTFQGNRTTTTFNPGTMNNNTTYYWRIDELGPGGKTTGTVWSFTTAPALPWSDGFESGNFTAGGWTTQNSYATVQASAKHTGIYGARLARTTWIEKRKSTTGYNAIHVKYDRRTTYTSVTLYVEWSINGSTWNNLETTTSTTWASKDFTCTSGADNNSNFRIRFRTSGSYTYRYAYIDNVNITGTLPQYTISGTVTYNGSGLDGVTMGGLPGNPVTSGGGLYTATVDYGWSGTVTPTKAGYTFAPPSVTYTNVTSNQLNQNYTATLNTYTISGYIENECNEPIEGVLVDANNGGGQDTTDVNGFYEVGVDYNWSGTVTPSKAQYTFEPNLMSYVGVVADQPDQNYVAHDIYDLDYDCYIGWGDVAVIHDNWLQPGEDIPGDFYKDEADTVNFCDFAKFAEGWNQ